MLTNPYSETFIFQSDLLSNTAPAWVDRGGAVILDGSEVKGGIDEQPDAQGRSACRDLGMSQELVSLIVAFRSAKRRSFAERTTTVFDSPFPGALSILDLWVAAVARRRISHALATVADHVSRPDEVPDNVACLLIGRLSGILPAWRS